MGGSFDPVRDSAGLPNAPSRFDPVRDSVASSPGDEGPPGSSGTGGSFPFGQGSMYDESPVHQSPIASDSSRQSYAQDDGFSSRQRRPTRSASIADILNDDEGGSRQPGSSHASTHAPSQSPRGIAVQPPARYAQPQAFPQQPVASISPHLPGGLQTHVVQYPQYSDELWQLRSSPTTSFSYRQPPIHPQQYPPYLQPGIMMPPSPLHESPRSRLQDLPPQSHYDDPRSVHAHYDHPYAPHHRSPSLSVLQPPVNLGLQRQTSSTSTSSGEFRSSHVSHRLERSPSLHTLLNDRSDERKRPTSSASVDYGRPMGPPSTPGGLSSQFFSEMHSTSSSPIDGPRKPFLEAPGTITSWDDHARPRENKSHGSGDSKQAARFGSDLEERFPRGRPISPPVIVSRPLPTSQVPSPSEADAPIQKAPAAGHNPVEEPKAAPVRPAYKPRTRVSAPTTVRIPITAAEADRLQSACRNPLRQQWQQEYPGRSDGWDSVREELARAETTSGKYTSQSQSKNGATLAGQKRKKPSSSVSQGRDEEVARQEARDNASLVAAHYNARQDVGLGARNQSPILPLRNFNNWIKSVLIQMFVRRGGRVLDLGGGKGGDLNKWAKGGVRELILADIAEVSVAQARDRYHERRFSFLADFFALDCFGSALAEHIPREILAPLFDNVSLQFCLHYGWEDMPKAQLMLENVARYLKPGGVFVGTMPDCDNLRSRLVQAQQESPPSWSFGNHFYRVDFDPDPDENEGSNGGAPLRFPPFGQRYTFTLLDAVDQVAEYVVDWPQLQSLAAQNGLQCVYRKPFADVWQSEGQTDRFRDLARRMVGSTPARNPPMDPELWEACSLYVAFAFEKRAPR